jgi:carboxypeptidase Q
MFQSTTRSPRPLTTTASREAILAVTGRQLRQLPAFFAGILMVLGAATQAVAGDDKATVAWKLVEDLTTEIGPRQAGTAAEASAREWSVKRLTSLGFQNVRIEPFDMPTWVRGEERASLTSPVTFNLAITALGNSGATPAKGIEGDVIVFKTFDAFKAAPATAIKGKIVYVGHAMTRTQDGSSYGVFGAVRRQGPNLAAKMGAAAFVIRSIGTDGHRNPHTGNTNFEAGVSPIPSAAVSNPDADQIERLAARNAAPLRMKLLLTPRFIGTQRSGNVLAEIPGSDPAAGIVLAACHLDSWDLGTGAIDDGAGCAIIADAALRAASQGKLRRTIRLLFAGAEEVGIHGGAAYFNAHKDEPHALASESDFGADRVWRLDVRLPDSAMPLKARLAEALAPLGVAASNQPAGGGADVAQLIGAGVSGVDLQQDGTHYFDLHHTPDDTLDKIDPAQLEQNVQAWAIMMRTVANAPEDLLGPRK